MCSKLKYTIHSYVEQILKKYWLIRRMLNVFKSWLLLLLLGIVLVLRFISLHHQIPRLLELSFLQTKFEDLGKTSRCVLFLKSNWDIFFKSNMDHTHFLVERNLLIDTILAKQSRWTFLCFPFYFPEKRPSRLLCEYSI